MKVVILGGSGLIGRALAADLARSDGEVWIVSRRPQALGPLPGAVRSAAWDGESASGWGGLVDGARALVNLAGENIGARRWSERRKEAILASRVRSVEAAVEALGAAAARPEVLIQASAVGLYGSRGDEELPDTAPAGVGFLATTTEAWERASQPVEGLGVRRVLLRTGVVLAREGGALPRVMLPFRLGVGGPVGDGRQWLPWIHLADVVAAIRFLIERRELAGAVNLTAPAPATNREFSRALARALHRPCLLRAPEAALRLGLGEMAELVLSSQRALPRRLLEAGFHFRFPDLAPALRDLAAS